ncbi:hypothetical protein C8R44DRAFT_873209 [Mycena epipterygia]|nr:hypothetical protein C8R44DRAFT_873209 [Mycena epipterygia]
MVDRSLVAQLTLLSLVRSVGRDVYKEIENGILAATVRISPRCGDVAGLRRNSLYRKREPLPACVKVTLHRSRPIDLPPSLASRHSGQLTCLETNAWPSAMQGLLLPAPDAHRVLGIYACALLYHTRAHSPSRLFFSTASASAFAHLPSSPRNIHASSSACTSINARLPSASPPLAPVAQRVLQQHQPTKPGWTHPFPSVVFPHLRAKSRTSYRRLSAHSA